MLKSTLLYVLMLVSISSFAQNDQESTVETDSLSEKISSELTKMFTTKISMKVDTVYFEKKMGNIYFSEANKAMLFAMAVPQPIEKAKESLNKESSKKDYKLKEKGQMMVDGKEVFYQKGTTKKDGEKYNLNVYAIKGDTQTTIFLSSMFLPGNEKIMEPMILEALKTVKLAGTKK